MRIEFADTIDEATRPGWRWTVCVRPHGEVTDFVTRFVAVWRVIASWGTWADPGSAWPDDDVLVAQLPASFREQLSDSLTTGIDTWLTDLDERSWRVVRVTTHDSEVVVELAVSSLPMSTWALRHVLERLGSTVTNSALGGPP